MNNGGMKRCPFKGAGGVPMRPLHIIGTWPDTPVNSLVTREHPRGPEVIVPLIWNQKTLVRLVIPRGSFIIGCSGSDIQGTQSMNTPSVFDEGKSNYYM